MASKPSYLALAGQLLVVLAVFGVLALVLQPWAVQVPFFLAGGVGAALVARTVAGRRLADALEMAPDALARCSVLLVAERLPVGGAWKLKVGATRAAWAPGVLGVTSGEVSFVPRAARWAHHAWRDQVRGVQLKAMWPGTAVAVRVHGAQGTAQFTVARPEQEVRGQLDPYLRLVDGWDTSLVPVRADPPAAARQRSWPQLYAVRLELADGTEAAYQVVTYLDERKAEALAVGRHAYLHGEEPAVRGAHVEDVGPAARDERGLVEIRGTVFDRAEF